MIDVAEAIDGEAVAVNYRTVGNVFDQNTGKTAHAPGASVVIQAAVQPASGRQLMDLPEGLRIEARFIAWTRTDVAENGQIQYAGEWFRIIYRWPRPQDAFVRVAMGRLEA